MSSRAAITCWAVFCRQLEGVGPEDLSIAPLVERGTNGPRCARWCWRTSATVDGQTTAHYVTERLQRFARYRLTRACPRACRSGGELDYLDEGTLAAAY